MDNKKDLDGKKIKLLPNKKISLIILFVAIILTTLGVGYYYFLSQQNIDKNNNNDIENKNDNKVEPPKYQVANWNDSVAYTPSQSFYKELSAEAEYNNVATLKTGETVVRVLDFWLEDYFLVDENNNVTFLSKYSSSNSLNNLATGVKTDSDITIPEIFPEEDITYNGQILEFKNRSIVGRDYTFSEPNITKIKEMTYGDLYESRHFMNDDLYVRRFYVKTPDIKAMHFYDLKNIDIYNDDRTLKVNWDDETNKTITWEMPISSCGNNGSRLHIKNYNISMGTKIGTTDNNDPLYRLTDDKILKLLYDFYYYDTGTEGWNHNLTFAQFKDNLTSVVYQDAFGEWIVLQNDKYSHAAECGKPVIYLYPEKDTYVNVEVGAKVTISDPLYVTGGWKNVFARSDGNLTYQGKEYESLYWEGTGFGTYPNVSKVGKIVTQDKLLLTIESDLKAQGLNPKERADFIDFWKNHLPKSPYVKLTWLTTEQMNILAPLRINPKPDTVIRVFLDAKGLAKPYKLTPQELVNTERKGFTLVEWGGLLIK